jgi:hypothetical protein
LSNIGKKKGCEKNMTNLEEFKIFCNKDISKYLAIDEKEMFSPASEYFYIKILESKDLSISDKLDNDQFLERCYACLIAWRLNRGQSWLVSFEDFKKQLQSQSSNLEYFWKIKKLENIKEEISENSEIGKKFNQLFTNLSFVTVNKQEKKSESKFVSISKTLHFLLPDLIIPMDNAYTSKIITFYGRSDKQCRSFLKVLNLGKELLNNKKNDIDKYYKNLERKQIIMPKPKLIDNLIINYVNELPKKENKKGNDCV